MWIALCIGFCIRCVVYSVRACPVYLFISLLLCSSYYFTALERKGKKGKKHLGVGRDRKIINEWCDVTLQRLLSPLQSWLFSFNRSPRSVLFLWYGSSLAMLRIKELHVFLFIPLKLLPVFVFVFFSLPLEVNKWIRQQSSKLSSLDLDTVNPEFRRILGADSNIQVKCGKWRKILDHLLLLVRIPMSKCKISWLKGRWVKWADSLSLVHSSSSFPAFSFNFP